MKTRMKKSLCILLAVVMLFSLAGCTAGPKEESQSSSQQGSSQQGQAPGGIQPLAAAVYPQQAAYANYNTFMEELYQAMAQESDKEALAKLESEAYAQYEEAARAWNQEREARDQKALSPSEMEAFYKTMLSTFFTSKAAEDSENKVFSPVNIYLALSMLAECAEGDSRAELLSLLGAASVEELRGRAGRLFLSNYRDDGQVADLLANSLWLRDDFAYQEDLLQTLAQHHFASSYYGKMGSEEMNRALQTWMNEQTRNLLKDQIDGITLEPSTVMALVSTLYYKASWSERFSEAKEGIFHGPCGDETCDMMNQEMMGEFYDASEYWACRIPLMSDGSMLVMLPKEGVDVSEIWTAESTLPLILGSQLLYSEEESVSYNLPNHKMYRISLTMPKFDVSCQAGLVDYMKELGVSTIFEPGKANFLPVAKNPADAAELYISEILHGARVKTDEDGVEGAAYTEVVMATGAMIMDDFVELVLDSPFAFVLQSENGTILFAGEVNTMQK